MAAAAPAAAPAAGGSITFPDDYPNSVKHFLLIGSLGCVVGAVVALYFNLNRTKPSVVHSLLFLIGATGAMGYYAMWTGLGAVYKTTDATPRVIFWARYLTQFVTQPMLLVVLSFVGKFDTPTMVSVVAEDALLVMAGYLGSTTVAPVKYLWWLTTVFFTVLISYQILPTAAEAHAVYRNAVYATVVCLALFNFLWLMGSEGSASLGLSQEVGLYVIVDVVLKSGLGLYLLFNYDAVCDGDEEISSQQYV
eukprot:CAMPEP_0174925686 /NCGR_PEP_ID=MMETSP1355-20121228/8080_1 /TAXON_ID=464990 /ORGANISM="Hemiselmis tepida, Strain CCMP443" /LENGTH=249 /DNA_ID=CAMNT_0016171633 /DNA_START=28 /DNA_END=777 /DNA_ORIENTATION=+